MKPLVIGVAGGTGAGKSTVARNVAAALGDASVAFIDMDAYYLDHGHLSLEERRKVNWDHPNAFDWDHLVSQLAQLGGGKAIDKPVYDFVNHARRCSSTSKPDMPGSIRSSTMSAGRSPCAASSASVPELAVETR